MSKRSPNMLAIICKNCGWKHKEDKDFAIHPLCQTCRTRLTPLYGTKEDVETRLKEIEEEIEEAIHKSS